MGKDYNYEIVEHLTVLSRPKGNKGWGKEVNLVKWGTSSDPGFDIRSWKHEDWDNRDEKEPERPGKGITLSDDETGVLMDTLLENY